MRNYPAQSFINKLRECHDGHIMIISVSTITGDYKGKSVTYVFELKNNEAETDNNNYNAIEQIGQTLHPCL